MRLYGVIIIMCVFIAPIILSAKSQYIKIAETTNQSKLDGMYAKFDDMNLPITHVVKDNKYIVYSGPYKNEDSVAAATNRINKYFPNMLLASNKNNYKRGFFIGTSLGYDEVTSSVSGTSSAVLPKKNGYDYGLDAGYNFENGLFASVGYLKANNDNIEFDNIYGSFNYRVAPYYDFSPYFGVVAGYSSVTWNTNPLSGAVPSNNQTNSPLIGPQIGLMYTAFKFFTLYTSYQFMYVNHVANLNSLTGN